MFYVGVQKVSAVGNKPSFEMFLDGVHILSLSLSRVSLSRHHVLTYL